MFFSLNVIYPVMFLIKLGGSVITEKASTQGVFKQGVMDNLAKSIYDSKKEIVLVHGAGSFGHVLAKKYHLNDGLTDPKQKIGYALTHAKVQQLNSYVIESLQKKGVAAVSIPPHATVTLDNHKTDTFQKEIFHKYLKKGFTPVTFGDVVLDESLGFSICSGDLLIEVLADMLKPEKVIFVMDEDGLFTSNPKKDPHAEFIHEIKANELDDLTTRLDDHADVTKGMEGKLQTIKNVTNLNIDTILLNGNKPDRLYDVLVGNKTTCTLIQR